MAAPESPTRRSPRLAEERVDHRFKGLPPDADGLTVGELAAQRRNLFTGGFTTPVLALSAERLEHNLALMETYAARHGLAFAPHGKTSMAPQLFRAPDRARRLGHHPRRPPPGAGGPRVRHRSGSSWPTSSWTRPRCAGSPPSSTPTRTSASSATSTPCAASS